MAERVRRPIAAEQMEQPGWFDNELVAQFLAKIKSQLVSWVVFLWGLYYLVPRLIRTFQQLRKNAREALETLRKFVSGVDLLSAFFEQLDLQKLENLVRLEREMGNTNFADKLREVELMLLCEANTRLTSMSVSGRAFWEADSKGNFTFVSIGFARLLSASPSDCKGKGWLAFVQDSDRARVLENWFEAVTQERQFHCFWAFNKATGDVLSVVGSASPVFDAQGKVFKFVGIVNLIQEGKPVSVDSGPNEKLKN